MSTRDSILNGNYQELDQLFKERDDWKERAESAIRLLGQIAKVVDNLKDSPMSLQFQMNTFLANWNRSGYECQAK